MNHDRPVPQYFSLLIVLALLVSALVVKPVSAASIVVSSLNDSGAGSLRQAITDIQPGGTITFDTDLSGQTIPLSSTLVINKTMDINGSMLDLPINISGGDAVRVFNVNPGVTATLIFLKISNGYSDEANDAGSGGGIRNYGTLTVRFCTITDNQSAWNGGGIRNNGTLVLENSMVSRNQAEGFGGGVQNIGTMVVTDSIFFGNTANNGAGIDNNTGTLDIFNSTLEDNVSKFHGGGIHNNGGVLTLMNSTLSNNKANGTWSEGGGIAISSGTAVITNSTFYGNHGQFGGGISNRGNLTYINTIIAGSVGYSDCTSEFGTIHSSSTHNLVEDGSCFVTTNLPGDPKLGPLANNGGMTLTHALLPSSPAIDAGSGAHCPDFDQRGVPRPQGAGCDIGAYELEILVVTSIADGGDGSLRKSIADISPGGRITFSPTFSGQTITLSSNLVIEKNLTIDGSDLGVPITISGNNTVGVLMIGPSGVVTLESLKIINGNNEYGGGIYNMGQLAVLNCTLAENTGTDAGGAIFNMGDLWLSGSTLSDNQAFFKGGGIFNTGSLFAIKSIFSSNKAELGGGIRNDEGIHSQMTVTHSTFYENKAAHGGAIDVWGDGPNKISTSSFYGNTAAASGGAIRIWSSLIVENSTLSGNSTQNIGGGFNIQDEGMLTLQHVTLNDNMASSGGGIYVGNNATLKYINTIIAHSTNEDCVDHGTIHADCTHNLVTDGSCGALLDDDPMLGLLANNGGPTLTHALLSGSPAIDAGHNGYCTTTDQRGVSRPQGAACDIGAFEFDPATDGFTFIFLPLIVK